MDGVVCSHESNHSGSPASARHLKPLIDHRRLSPAQDRLDTFSDNQITKKPSSRSRNHTCVTIESPVSNNVVDNLQIYSDMITTYTIALMTRNHHLRRWYIMYRCLII